MLEATVSAIRVECSGEFSRVVLVCCRFSKPGIGNSRFLLRNKCPLYPKVAHCTDKVAHDSGPMAFQVADWGHGLVILLMIQSHA